MTFKLSDDFHQDEPLAYLVKNFDTTLEEYRVFANESDARRHVDCEEQAARDGGEPQDWKVYPLYAGEPT